MWELTGIVVCFIGTIQCSYVTDMFGPYETEEACLDREAEIMPSIMNDLKIMFPYNSINDFSFDMQGCKLSPDYTPDKKA